MVALTRLYLVVRAHRPNARGSSNLSLRYGSAAGTMDSANLSRMQSSSIRTVVIRYIVSRILDARKLRQTRHTAGTAHPAVFAARRIETLRFFRPADVRTASYHEHNFICKLVTIICLSSQTRLLFILQQRPHSSRLNNVILMLQSFITVERFS